MSVKRASEVQGRVFRLRKVKSESVAVQVGVLSVSFGAKGFDLSLSAGEKALLEVLLSEVSRKETLDW